MLCLVTNRKIIKSKDFYDVIRDASLGGIDTLILREKDLSYEKLLQMSYKIKEILDKNNIKFIVNGNIEVAKKVQAYGFHTGYKNFMENTFDFSGVIGVSVHSLTEAIKAQNKGADYLLAGHVYETNCKIGLKPRGEEFIHDIACKINIPLIAIGGINEKNLENVICSGANGVAVMSYIMSSPNPYNSTKLLKNNLSKL